MNVPGIAVVWSSTDHDNQQHVSDLFLFYNENEAIESDKPNDDEAPCRKTLVINVIIETAS